MKFNSDVFLSWVKVLLTTSSHCHVTSSIPNELDKNISAGTWSNNNVIIKAKQRFESCACPLRCLFVQKHRMTLTLYMLCFFKKRICTEESIWAFLLNFLSVWRRSTEFIHFNKAWYWPSSLRKFITYEWRDIYKCIHIYNISLYSQNSFWYDVTYIHSEKQPPFPWWSIYCSLNGKLWYLQHSCVGDTIVYH